MNDYYQDLLTPIIFSWASHQDHAHVCNAGKICIQTQGKSASILFHEDNVIELSVVDQETRVSLFYLHLQMHDLKMAKESLVSFFCFLGHEPRTSEAVQLEGKMHILLSCTSGLTTSYFAYLMEEQLGSENVHVEAVSISRVEEMADAFDVILLAPQVSYHYPVLKKKYGDKVMMIDMMDFATGDVGHVVQRLSCHQRRASL